MSQYDSFVRCAYGLLRFAWERAVEEVVLGKVVQRFDNSVRTQNLKKLEITENDCRIVRQAMSKCSKFCIAHSTQIAAVSSVPEPDELDSDISNLVDFIAEIKQRRKS